MYFHWLVSLPAPRVSQDLATYLESSLLCHLSNNDEEDDNNKIMVMMTITMIPSRMAEVVQRHEGPSPKSFDSDKNLSTNIRYFVRILRFAVIYALFVRLGGKKVFFLAQQRRILSKSALLHGLY